MSKAAMHWEFSPQWAAWWLIVSEENSATAQRGYGPFNETEAVWAGEVHGVPFRSLKDTK